LASINNRLEQQDDKLDTIISELNFLKSSRREKTGNQKYEFPPLYFPLQTVDALTELNSLVAENSLARDKLV
jgi:hypothetical protein